MNFKSAIAMVSISAIVISLILVAGCTTQNHNLNGDPSDHACSEVKNYGNGVIYFDCTEIYFGTALSEYLGSHNATVSAIAPVPDWWYENRLKGYFVVVK